MSITIRKGEEIHKIFHNNKYVGYLDENEDLYGFNERGYAEKIDSCVSFGNATKRFLEWQTPKPEKRKKRCGKQEMMLIRNLAMELELHNSQSINVKKAMKYLDEIGK